MMSELRSRPHNAKGILLKHFGVLFTVCAMIYLAGIYFMAQPNSTRDGLLPQDKDNPVLLDAHELLSRVPEINSLSDNAIRFAAMPSFGGNWFAVALSNNGKQVRGYAVIWDQKTQRKSIANFSIPSTVYDRMTSEFDKQINGYWGEASWWTDGTPLAFERKLNGQIVSGVGNSPCHYTVMTNVLARNLSDYVPNIAELVEPGAENYAQSEHCNNF